MSFLFGSDEKPAPAAVPVSPLASEDAQRERQAAEDAALNASRESGRRQTVAAGRDIAMEDQQVLGQSSARRRASRELVG